jgi:hypothetical protein
MRQGWRGWTTALTAGLCAILAIGAFTAFWVGLLTGVGDRSGIAILILVWYMVLIFLPKSRRPRWVRLLARLSLRDERSALRHGFSRQRAR